ncbi:MAG TPA: lipopolysaccharide biosynthesis protein [Bryobacteraceae bacterium]|nr:lipopolysaccharide biosynthesis protein [Bryobacteraceae bacterium]
MTTGIVVDNPQAATGALRPGASVRANFVWVFVANTIYLASQWLIISTVAKLSSSEMVGQLSLGFAITAPIFLLSNLRLRTVLATDAHGEYGLPDYLAVRLLMTLAALAVVCGIGLLDSSTPQTALVVICVALAKSFESGSDLFYGLFLRCDQANRMTVSILVRGAGSVLAVAVACYFRRDAVSAAMALCLSSGLLLLLCDLPLAAACCRRMGDDGLRFRWHIPTLRRLAARSAPLGTAAMLMSLGVNIPRYFIQHVLSASDVGLFSAVFYVAMAGGYAVSALAEGASPRLATTHAFGVRNEFNRVLRNLVSLGVAAGIGALLVFFAAGKEILAIVYRPEYVAGWRLLLCLGAAAVLANTASIFSYALIAVRRYRDQLGSLIAMTIVTTVACQFLVPAYALTGAAAAMMLGYGVQAGWGLVAVRRAETAEAIG